MYVTTTKLERITGTLLSKHKCLTNPTVTPEDAVLAATQQLAQAIQGTIPQGNEQLEQVHKVVEVFSNITNDKAKEARDKEVKHNRINIPK